MQSTHTHISSPLTQSFSQWLGRSLSPREVQIIHTLEQRRLQGFPARLILHVGPYCDYLYSSPLSSLTSQLKEAMDFTLEYFRYLQGEIYPESRALIISDSDEASSRIAATLPRAEGIDLDTETYGHYSEQILQIVSPEFAITPEAYPHSFLFDSVDFLQSDTEESVHVAILPPFAQITPKQLQEITAVTAASVERSEPPAASEASPTSGPRVPAASAARPQPPSIYYRAANVMSGPPEVPPQSAASEARGPAEAPSRFDCRAEGNALGLNAAEAFQVIDLRLAPQIETPSEAPARGEQSEPRAAARSAAPSAGVFTAPADLSAGIAEPSEAPPGAPAARSAANSAAALPQRPHSKYSSLLSPHSSLPRAPPRALAAC